MNDEIGIPISELFEGIVDLFTDRGVSEKRQEIKWNQLTFVATICLSQDHPGKFQSPKSARRT
jgi:hypothetical protein